MKKIVLLHVVVFLCTVGLSAQQSTITGIWERGIPKTIKLFKIDESSNLSEVASSAVGQDGSFKLQFISEKENYYVLGLSSAAYQNRYTFYFKPGDNLNIRVTSISYELTGKDNTPENKELTRWHEFILPLEDKAVYFQGKRSTYVDFFPLLEEKLSELKSYKVKKTKNKVFNASFEKFRQYDLLSVATQFIYTVRSIHPKVEDYIDYYRQIDVTALAQTDDILYYPTGVRLFVNAYMLKNMILSPKTSDFKRMDPVSSLLKEDINMIGSDRLKGELMLMFSNRNMTRVGLMDYKKNFGYLLVTENQKQRWQLLEDSFKENTKGKKPVNLKFPDRDGKEVSLSNFRGKVIYIDVWATWCGPCKREMPALKKLEEEYKSNKDIVFVGISVDASKHIQKWKDFLVKEQLPGVQLFGGDMSALTLSKPFKIKGIPRFMIVGKDGCLLYENAPRPSSSEIRAVLNEALKQ